MRKKGRLLPLLALALALTCAKPVDIFAGGGTSSVSTQSVASGTVGSDNVSWEITGTKEAGYTLLISGSGKMGDTNTSTNAPWRTYGSYVTKVVI